MASIKKLKKQINYTLGDLAGEALEFTNVKEGNANAETIVDEVVTTFDELIARVNTRNVESKKSHFKSINTDLQSKVQQISDKISNL